MDATTTPTAPVPVSSQPLEIPTFSSAGQPEILRAHQRDQAQLGRLTELTRDVMRAAFGSRQVLPKENLISLLSAVVYFGLTYGRGSQTIGEEYVDIQPRSVVSEKSPSRKRRLFTILLTVLSPPLFRSLLRRLRAQTPRRPLPTTDDEDPALARSYQERLLDVMEKLESWVEVASEVNLAWFFLRGGFFSLGKRIAGVGYVSTLPPIPDLSPSDQPTYSVLGLLLLFPLAKRLHSALPPLASIIALNSTSDATATVMSESKPSRFYLPNATLPLADASDPADHPPAYAQDEKPDAGSPDEKGKGPAGPNEARKCTLCLEEWTDPAVTECGHVFCWACVVGWSGEKAECPLCRQNLNPSRLLPLYNM